MVSWMLLLFLDYIRLQFSLLLFCSVVLILLYNFSGITDV